MGTQLQAALTAIDDFAARATEDSQLLIAAKCRGLIRGYDARWRDAGFSTADVEGVVLSDLWNPETGRKSRSFRVAGKIDVTGSADRRTIIDHKSTSEDITDHNAPYWRQLMIEGQVSHYMLLEWLNGRKVDEAMWDVMRKPGISPRKLESKREIADTLASGVYYGAQISPEDAGYVRETGRETLAMYEARLAWDCTETRPQWYFQRRAVPRTNADLHEYASELWAHSQDMLHSRRENHWPRNSGACMLYHSPCKFLGLCSGFDTPESDNWKKKEFVHVELSGIDGDGRDVLTNSRIRTFQTCRRKHFYEYEMGITRHDAEEREALVFGSLWHVALENWFLVSKGAVNVNDNDTDSSGNAPGTVATTNQTPVYL